MLLKGQSGTGTKVLACSVFTVCLAVIFLILAAQPLLAAGPWPEGLREAVNSYFQALQVTDYRTRDSTLEEPLGIQPMTEFDRAGHKCHEVPGQVYRIYKVPNFFSEDEGSYAVRSKFQLFYRQAEDVVGVFSQPWEQGSDGAIRVRFEKVDGNWEMTEKRELLE